MGFFGAAATINLMNQSSRRSSYGKHNEDIDTPPKRKGTDMLVAFLGIPTNLAKLEDLVKDGDSILRPRLMDSANVHFTKTDKGEVLACIDNGFYYAFDVRFFRNPADAENWLNGVEAIHLKEMLTGGQVT